ncbi:peptidase family M20/M25/M40 protein [Xylariales sp. AK1849]|nr:peptidase family M20/M25/M40 protein [Xylariales sp. AK1849]
MEQEPRSPIQGTLASLQSQTKSVRRARPPDINVIGNENRIPLRVDSRPERIAKRETRIGLRSIFGRQKTGDKMDAEEWESPSSLRKLQARPGGIRASLVEISNWPYGLHSSRSEVSLSSPPPPSSSNSTSSALQSRHSVSRLRSPSVGKSKLLPTAPSPSLHSGSGGISWVPPPMFQAYPQAIKTATLPYCNASVDALLRLSDRRNSLLMREDLASTPSSLDSDESGEKKAETGKKIHQRNGGSRSLLDWSNKTYVLVTSGYLLQYAAEGSFDRSPERILHLTKESAAFASDLIPGRHWVLQVCSSTDSDGTPITDTRSLFSKLALRGFEKKNVSNFLMVFESAEDMDDWLAILRREIEELGGKRKLSETGTPEMEDTTVQLKTQPSQRTLVVRDPARFSSVVKQQDFSWSNENALKEDGELLAIPSSEPTPEISLDDVSTTESHYSSDGQHLDSLRDSNNRLSYISSGQRTYVTSAGSSPACSPTRASFSSLVDDPNAQSPGHLPGQVQDNQPEIRVRPNAQAIASRRQSMQALIPGYDNRSDPSTGPHLTIANATDNSDHHQNSHVRPSIPNFSKRFSTSRWTPLESASNQAQMSEQEVSTKMSRKAPPTALAMSRPLSTVMDQPSPRSPLSPSDPLKTISAVQSQSTTAPDTPSMFSSWGQSEPNISPKRHTLPSRKPVRAFEQRPAPASEPHIKTSPRHFVSMTSLRTPKESSPATESDVPQFVLPGGAAPPPLKVRHSLNLQDELPRSSTSMGTYGLDRRLSTAPAAKIPSYRRANFLAENSPFRQARHSFAHADELCPITDEQSTLLSEKCSMRQSRYPLLSSSNQSLNVDFRAKAPMGRRSMPQLAEGPPPVPPPTCALPPIPKKESATERRILT